VLDVLAKNNSAIVRWLRRRGTPALYPFASDRCGRASNFIVAGSVSRRETESASGWWLT
jgi:hypothetical protein